MKYIRILLILSLLALSSACAKEDTKDMVTSDMQADTVLDTMRTQYGLEKKQGIQTEYIYTYSDGSEEYEKMESSFDREKGIWYWNYKDTQDIESEQYNIREQDGDYTYISDEDTGEWIRYMQEEDENGKTTYQYQEEGNIFSYTEENGYLNVKYKTKGTEKLNGKDTLKIEISGDETYSSQQDIADEETQEITRKTVLDDYELTEEAVKSVEGLSEALDQYVSALNGVSDPFTEPFVTTIWIDTQTALPVRAEIVQKMDNLNVSSDSEAMREFEENSWKAYIVQEAFADGLSLDEALREVEKQRPQMEKEIAEEREELELEAQETGEQEDGLIKSTTQKSEYLYGDDCKKIPSAPEKYTEVTQEQYFSGEY